MDIVDKIKEAELALLKLTGKDPKKVYIGFKDKYKLQTLIDKHPCVQINRTTQRMQVLGLQVYIVDEEQYLEVGL